MPRTQAPRRLRAVLLAAALIAGAFLVPAPAMAGYAAIVVEADSGKVLYARNALDQNHPASLTKMMTLYLVFEALDAGRIAPTTRWRVSERAAGQPPSNLGLSAGESMTVDQAIRALAVRSANDVATVVAEGLGGSEIAFARQMTDKARELGMTRTVFRNASGLHHSAQVSTAADMALLGRALLRRFPKFYHYFSTDSFAWGSRAYHNHNGLLGNYDGADGIKTGYIRQSGFNLVASASRNGVRLVGVVFGGRTARSRDLHMEDLLDKAWAQARVVETAAAEPQPKPVVEPVTVQVASIGPAEPTAVVQEGDTGGDWAIQVGAFKLLKTARDAAAAVSRRLVDLPGEAHIDVAPLPTRTRTLYRARIAGLDEDNARGACKQLRRRGETCALILPDGTMQVVSGS
ncbi:MAG: serine hydrolase [Alphaproteobacteria bacterium]